MQCLGVDIGKNTHVASLINEDSKTIFRAFSFSNTVNGTDSLIEKLNQYIESVSGVEIGMEATGHY